MRTDVATSLSWVVCETATNTKDYSSLPVPCCLGDTPKRPPSAPTLLQTDTTTQLDTLTCSIDTQCSQAALCHKGGGGYHADWVECLFPSTTGWTALNTHMHKQTCTEVQMCTDTHLIKRMPRCRGHIQDGTVYTSLESTPIGIQKALCFVHFITPIIY